MCALKIRIILYKHLVTYAAMNSVKVNRKMLVLLCCLSQLGICQVLFVSSEELHGNTNHQKGTAVLPMFLFLCFGIQLPLTYNVKTVVVVNAEIQ